MMAFPSRHMEPRYAASTMQSAGRQDHRARVLRPESVSPVRWPNGAGHTRELIDESGAWRLSVEELQADADFPRVPGVDRKLLPLVDVVLHINGRGGRCRRKR